MHMRSGYAWTDIQDNGWYSAKGIITRALVSDVTLEF